MARAEFESLVPGWYGDVFHTRLAVGQSRTGANRVLWSMAVVALLYAAGAIGETWVAVLLAICLAIWLDTMRTRNDSAARRGVSMRFHRRTGELRSPGGAIRVPSTGGLFLESFMRRGWIVQSPYDGVEWRLSWVPDLAAFEGRTPARVSRSLGKYIGPEIGRDDPLPPLPEGAVALATCRASVALSTLAREIARARRLRLLDLTGYGPRMFVPWDEEKAKLDELRSRDEHGPPPRPRSIRRVEAGGDVRLRIQRVEPRMTLVLFLASVAMTGAAWLLTPLPTTVGLLCLGSFTVLTAAAMSAYRELRISAEGVAVIDHGFGRRLHRFHVPFKSVVRIEPAQGNPRRASRSATIRIDTYDSKHVIRLPVGAAEYVHHCLTHPPQAHTERDRSAYR